MRCPRLGRGLINGSQPQPDGFKLDKSKEIGGKLVVARRNPTTLFDLVEEPLDPVAGAGEMRAEEIGSRRLRDRSGHQPADGPR